MIRSNEASGARPRRLPLGFLGMMAIVAAFEGFLASHDSDFTDLSATDWRLTGKAARVRSRDAELLLFGDSLVKFGLVTDLLEARTGLKTFNLSVLGGQSASSYFTLRRAIEAGAAPKAIVVDCQDIPSVVGFAKRGLGLWPHIRNWPELMDSRDAVELARAADDSTLLGSIVLRRLLPSLKARNEIKANLGRYLKKGASRARYYAIVQRRNWEANRGSLLWGPKKEDKTLITPEQMNSPPADWSIDPVTDEFLAKFLTLAEAHQIQVFFLIPPTSPEHEGLRDRVHQHDFYTEMARRLQLEHPDLTVIDGRRSGYDRRVFFDDSHLDRVGATTFTLDVADAIARSLSGDATGDPAGRWFDLPRFRDRDGGRPLEDFDQSRLAIDNQWSRRR